MPDAPGQRLQTRSEVTTATSLMSESLKFASLFLGDGGVGRVWLLWPETLARMTTNQLTDSMRANTRSSGAELDIALLPRSLCGGARGHLDLRHRLMLFRSFPIVLHTKVVILHFLSRKASVWANRFR